MGFQGFARQDEFSTGQIKIDIDRVINNDLKEASRMSKYMASNAAFSEKYGAMYLNALTKKHEVEKRNREENFKFFMDNRAKIQEQVEYNNKVKAEDAARPDPYIPSFWESVQPAMMKMLVDVGGTAIKKAFDDHAKHKAEAKQQEIDDNKGEMVDYHSRINDTGRQYVSSPALADLRTKIANDETALEAMASHLHSLDPTISVKEHRSYLRARAGLTKVDAQAVANSPQIISNQLQQFALNHVMPYNGIDVTQSMVMGGQVNRELSKLWRVDMGKAFRKEYNIDNLLPETRGSVATTIRKVESQWLSQENNVRRRQAIKQTITAYGQRFESLANGPDGFNEQVNYMLNPEGGGPAQISGSRETGYEHLQDFARAGSWGVPEITRFMGPGPWNNNRNLFTEKSERGETWRKIRSEAIRDQYQTLQVYNMKVAYTGESYLISMNTEGYDPQEAEHLLAAASAPAGVDNTWKTFLSSIPSATKTKILTRAGEISGKMQPVGFENPAYAAVDKAYTGGDVVDIVKHITHEAAEGLENEKSVTELLKHEAYRAEPAVRSWLAGLKENYDKDNIMSEGAFSSLVSKILGEKGHKDREQLLGILRPKTFELKPDGGKKYFKKARWPFLEKGLEGSIPKATGVSEFTGIISQSNGVLNMSEVTGNEVINEAISSYMGDLDKAQKAGEDISHMVMNPPAVIEAIAQRLHNGSSSQVINYFIRDQFTDMKPLSGNNLFTQEEVQKVNQRITGWNKMGKQASTYFLQSEGNFTPNNNYPTQASNAAPASSSVSHIGNGLHAVGMPTALGGGQNGTWTDPNHEDHFDLKWNQDGQAQWMYDYFKLHNIVMTEVKGRGNDITVPHSTVGNFTHGSGHGGDVPLDSRNGLGGGAVGMEADHIFRDKLFTRLKSGGDHFNKGLTPQEAYEFDLYGGRTYPARSFS